MIKTTMGQLLASEPALGRMLKKDLPMKVSYHLTKLYKFVMVEITIFNDKRNELVKEHGKESATGDFEVTGDDAKRAFFKKIQEFLDVEVAIAWGPITKTQLDAVDGLCVSGVDLIELGPLFSDD